MEPSSFTKEKYELYRKYQQEIHHDEPSEVSAEGFRRFLVDSPLDQVDGKVNYGSYHQKYILDGTLIAVAVLDILPHCVSSVYFMYDPAYAFLGLGNYSALREISLTQEFCASSSDLKYYYMGKSSQRNYMIPISALLLLPRLLHPFMCQDEVQGQVSPF